MTHKTWLNPATRIRMRIWCFIFLDLLNYSKPPIYKVSVGGLIKLIFVFLNCNFKQLLPEKCRSIQRVAHIVVWLVTSYIVHPFYHVLVTPGGAKFLMVHDLVNEDGIRNFFVDVYEIWIRSVEWIMNALYKQKPLKWFQKAFLIEFLIHEQAPVKITSM